MSKITDKAGRVIWEAIVSSGVMDIYNAFDDKGNLESRTYNTTGHQEIFSYVSKTNMLDEWQVYKNGTLAKTYTMSYDTHGNVTNKTDIGNLRYFDQTKAYRLTNIGGNPASISDDTQDITYTDFKKVKTISEGYKYLELDYGIQQQRIKSTYKEDNSTVLTRFYLGDYEEDYTSSGQEKVHYISSPNGIAAIYKEKNGVGTMYYAYTDHQGSLIALTNTCGVVVERYAYDPWGNRRDPNMWVQNDMRSSLITDRGYTFHEHLDNFDLINMNGRVYDPMIARFLSPDPQLQSPDNWLNYNCYAYCLNNPMLYTDPTGEFFWAALPLLAKVGIVVGAGVGGYTGYKIGEANGTTGLSMVGYMLGGAAIGGFSGYLGGTIAAGGGMMANTGAIMAGSYTNSMGMAMLSGGQMAPSISFGAASFNFGTGEFRSIFDWKDLSTMEKIGYGLGTFANGSDVYCAIMGAYGDKAGEADLVTKNDPIGHAELRTVPNEDGVSENLISVGPDWDRAVRGDSFWDAPGKNTWPTHSNDVDITVSKIRITNVRLDKIHEYVSTSLKNFRYKALSTNCVTSASNGLLKAGVLNIPFLRHPSLLQMQMLARRYAFLSPYMTEY